MREMSAFLKPSKRTLANLSAIYAYMSVVPINVLADDFYQLFRYQTVHGSHKQLFEMLQSSTRA